MPKQSSSKHGPIIPPESTFASLELVAMNNVFFATGEDAASVGFDEPETDDPDVMHAQEWLVTITERARKQAARREVEKKSGDFTRRYVDIESVDLGDEDEDENYAEDVEYDDDEEYAEEVVDEDRMDVDEGSEGRKRGRRSKSQSEDEWRYEYEDNGMKELKDDKNRQYDLMELIAAQDDGKDDEDEDETGEKEEVHEPDKKRPRSDDKHSSIVVPKSFVENKRRKSLSFEPEEKSKLLDKTLYTAKDKERLHKFKLPVREEQKNESVVDSSVKPLVVEMPKIGGDDGGSDEERREARHRRHEKILRCDVAAFVQEKLTPYYKAKRFANKESYKELAKHLTEKVVSAKIAANSLVMTENTRSRISKLVYKTMHPHGAHHFVYDSSVHHHADDDDDDAAAATAADDSTDLPSPLVH